MANNFYGSNNAPLMPERILSALGYLTFGTVSLVLVIISAVAKAKIKPYVQFNAYQAILIAAIFAVVHMTFNVVTGLLQFLNIIPFIGTFINSFLHFVLFYFISFPLIIGQSLFSLILLAIILYLTCFSILGKYPYIPYISDNIRRMMP